MRGGVVALLALIAAFAGPIRLACGASCAGEPAAAPKAALSAAHDAPCHKPEHQTQPVPEPASEPCTHDHANSIRPASRGAIQDVTLEPALSVARTATATVRIQFVAPAASKRLPPAWPPIRIVPLRI